MASTNNTANLHLNQWVGADKPKMEDFNRDNLLLDQIISDHLAGDGGHISVAERAGWNRAVPVIGTYVGDGEPMRDIELGFKPSFGIVYAVGKVLTSVASGTNMVLNSTMVSALGCSQGSTITDTGFTVINVPQTVAGRVALLNADGVTYVYIMYR